YLHRADYRTRLGILQRDIVKRYQRWYSTTVRLVNEFIPEWQPTFVSHYQSNRGMTAVAWGTNAALDYLLLNVSTALSTKDEIIADFINDLDRQIAILLSIPDAVEVKELNLRKLIASDVARTEIEHAEILFEAGFYRAAGSIAGVALE